MPRDNSSASRYFGRAMLHINDLTYRIEGRPILEGATVAIPTGHKVGLVGRNGSGKSTLLRLIIGEISPDDGSISTSRNARIGYVAQEAPGGETNLIEWVLSADTERARLMAEADIVTDANRIAAIHERLNEIGAHSAPSRAAQILAGLGFDEAAQQRPCSEYSGGWRMRVALAAVLFLEPEVLLLDEPTNYLDLEGTLWLESYLRNYPHTVVLVSHDRDLLNRAVGSIAHLDRGKITLFSGGYDAFEEARLEKQRLDLKLQKKQEEQRRHLEAFIVRFKAKASKAAQAQSRVKALARIKPIAAQIDDRVVPFRMPAPARLLPSPIVELERASVGYAAGTPVLSRLDLRLDQDDRIALLGQNGNGKSTFAKLIAGRLALLDGAMRRSPRLEIGYFAQHQLDDLEPELTPLDQITRLLPAAPEAERRTRLGSWGFGADKADTKSKNLSGGEKARLLMAMTTFHAPHVLILDEPTNHLDVDSREALVHALNEYEGAVILISHDRHLIEASADRLWIVKDGTVKAYEGDMETYRAELLTERGARSRSNGQGQDVDGLKISRADLRRGAAERRAQLAPLRRAMQAAEKRVEKIASEIAAIDALLADPSIYSREASRAQQLVLDRGLRAKSLMEAEEAWLAATEALEAAESVA